MSTYSNPWFNVFQDSESSDGQTRHNEAYQSRVLTSENKPALFMKPVKTPRRKRRTKAHIIQDHISTDICTLFA